MPTKPAVDEPEPLLIAGDAASGISRGIANQLSGISGKFILSINDTPLAREVFGRFGIERAETTYTISTAMGDGTRAGELIVRRSAG